MPVSADFAESMATTSFSVLSSCATVVSEFTGTVVFSHPAIASTAANAGIGMTSFLVSSGFPPVFVDVKHTRLHFSKYTQHFYKYSIFLLRK